MINQCKAIITTNNIKRQCKNKRKKNNFCYNHMNQIKTDPTKIITNINKVISKEKKQNILIINKYNKIITKDLNKRFSHNLMNIYESWAEVELNNRIFIDNEWWPLDIIIDIISYQLNNSSMENPYPTFPNNPFNRKLFTVSALMTIKDSININDIKVNIILKLLLNQQTNFLYSCYSDTLKSYDGFCPNLVTLFEQSHRFMIINEKNSQNLYGGLWVGITFPYSDFEELYYELRKLPYQIIYYGQVIDNPYRHVIIDKLNSMIGNIYDLDVFID
jgi:hypothetical protein